MVKLKEVNYILNNWSLSDAVDISNSELDSIGVATFVTADTDNPNYDGKVEGSFIEVAERVNVDVKITSDSSILQGVEKDVWYSYWIQSLLISFFLKTSLRMIPQLLIH